MGAWWQVKDAKNSHVTQARLLILSKYYIYSVKKSVTGKFQTQRKAHLYCLKFYGHAADDENVLRLMFEAPEDSTKSFELMLREDDVDHALELMHRLQDATEKICYQVRSGERGHLSSRLSLPQHH